MEFKKSALEEKSRENRRLQMKLGTARPTISRRKKVTNDIADRSCHSYSSLIRAHASPYCDWLNAVVGGAQACREYPGSFCVGLGEEIYSLHRGDKNSDEERGSCTSPPEGAELGDIVLALPPAPHFS